MMTGNNAILARDVAYYLLNAPSIDSGISRKALKRRHYKYYHFALRCVDAFILYDTLYWDHSVPNPLNKDWKSTDEQLYFKLLHDSGAISQIPLSKEHFNKIFNESVNNVIELRKTGDISQIKKKIMSYVQGRYDLLLENASILEEDSIFWKETSHDLYFRRPPFEGAKSALEMGYYHREIEDNLMPWVLSSLVCGKLQAILGFPGIYSSISFPCCAYLLSDQGIIEKEIKIRATLKGISEFYKRMVLADIEIQIPSFSEWCLGSAKQQSLFSNVDILKRGLKIRENKYIGYFRKKLWELVLSELSDVKPTEENEIKKKIETKLKKSISELIKKSLPTSIASKMKSTGMKILIGSPLGFLDPLGLASGLIVELFSKIFASSSEKKKLEEYGWLFFLHESISGFS